MNACVPLPNPPNSRAESYLQSGSIRERTLVGESGMGTLPAQLLEEEKELLASLASLPWDDASRRPSLRNKHSSVTESTGSLSLGFKASGMVSSTCLLVTNY